MANTTLESRIHDHVTRVTAEIAHAVREHVTDEIRRLLAAAGVTLGGAPKTDNKPERKKPGRKPGQKAAAAKPAAAKPVAAKPVAAKPSGRKGGRRSSGA